MTTTQQNAEKHGIVNPNTSGQGTHPEAADVPCRWILERRGWRYSHTTAVRRGDVHELRHTFTRGDHRFSAWKDRSDDRGTWRWSASWGGSSTETRGFSGTMLARDFNRFLDTFLARVIYNARRAGKQGFER